MTQRRGAQWCNNHSSIFVRPQRSLSSGLFREQSQDGVFEFDRTCPHSFALQLMKTYFTLKQRGSHLDQDHGSIRGRRCGRPSHRS